MGVTVSNKPILSTLLSRLRTGEITETSAINRLKNMNYHFTIEVLGNKDNPFRIYSKYMKSNYCSSLVTALIEFTQELIKLETPSGDGFLQL